MNKTTVYLSGAISNVSAMFQDWRNKCLEWSDNGLYTCLTFNDPNIYFNYTDKLPKTNKQCLDLFMWMIEQSDVLLVNLESSEFSCGTCMEIEHAYCRNIPIIAFGEYPGTWYSWAQERASIIFKTLEDAVEYINSSYGRV